MCILLVESFLSLASISERKIGCYDVSESWQACNSRLRSPCYDRRLAARPLPVKVETRISLWTYGQNSHQIWGTPKTKHCNLLHQEISLSMEWRRIFTTGYDKEKYPAAVHENSKWRGAAWAPPVLSAVMLVTWGMGGEWRNQLIPVAPPRVDSSKGPPRKIRKTIHNAYIVWPIEKCLKWHGFAFSTNPNLADILATRISISRIHIFGICGFSSNIWLIDVWKPWTSGECAQVNSFLS